MLSKFSRWTLVAVLASLTSLVQAQQAEPVNASVNPATSGSPVTLSTIACGTAKNYNVVFSWGTTSTSINNVIGTASVNNHPYSISWTPTKGGTYYIQATVASAPAVCTNWSSNILTLTVNAATPPPSYQGFVNPKYVVVGITYAPPGTNSNVTYGSTTTVGNTTTVNSSFQSGTSLSVSVSNGIGIPKGGIVNGGVQLTTTASSDYTQGSSSSTTNTLSKAIAITYKTSGYPTPTVTPAVSSDYDIVWIWLNPLVVYTYYPAFNGALPKMVNQGYAFDPTDPAGTGGADVYPVQVGYLNGHFADNPSIDSVLARTWTSSEKLQWPAGQGPGLNAADKANIVGLDPFTNPNYTELANLPSTTADGRFTQGQYPPNPLAYVPGVTTTYTATQTTTQTNSVQNTTSFQQAFGVSEEWSSTIFDLFTSTETFKEQQTFTWTHSTLNSLTKTTAISDGLTITGPSASYTGPTQFVYYQDNLFGTFAFPPS